MKKLLILAFLFGIKQMNAQVCFGEATTYATGSGAASIVYADFNADGNKDFAVSNNGSGDISILLGTGTGSFGAATSVAAGTGPYTLITADFNGDSKADLAIANHGSNDVSVLLGNGTGGFSPATSFGVGTGPISVTSADFNGDGFKDLATANFNSNNVSVLLGDGAGSFGTATSFSVGTSSSTPTPHSIVSGDFNGDGKMDIVTGNYSTSNVSVLLGTGSGSFGSATNFSAGANSAPYSMINADFNNDGKADLAFTSMSNASPNVSSAGVLIGNGTGGFAAAVNNSITNSANPTGITSGDFNADGKADLVVTNIALDNFYVLLGSGTGTLTTGGIFSLTPGSAPNAVVTTDLNGDGKLDLGVANWGANNISVLLSSALPTITASAYTTTVCSGQSDTLRGGGGSTYVWSGGSGAITNGVGFSPTATKTYTVVGTDTNGCTNKASITITVNPLPTLTVTATSSVVCFGQTTTLNASGASTYTWNTGATGSSAVVTPAGITIYTVTGTNTNGCKNTKTYTVTITPVITIYGSHTVCVGDSSLLLAYGANTYTWTTGNVVNDSLYIHPTTNGTYSVVGTDTASGCNSTVSFSVTVNCYAGINQNNNASAFTVYPNPSNGSFVVETNTNDAQLMQVFDVNGKMIFSQTIAGKSTIDAANLNEGIYSIKLSGVQGVVNKKLVIVK
jgi:hypothetical protein